MGIAPVSLQPGAPGRAAEGALPGDGARVAGPGAPSPAPSAPTAGQAPSPAPSAPTARPAPSRTPGSDPGALPPRSPPAAPFARTQLALKTPLSSSSPPHNRTAPWHVQSFPERVRRRCPFRLLMPRFPASPGAPRRWPGQDNEAEERQRPGTGDTPCAERLWPAARGGSALQL